MVREKTGSTEEREIKLNLGSRNRAIPGFLGLDCEMHDGVDILCDASDLSDFETGSVSALYASNLLEHFPHTKTLGVLTEWGRVLKKGGILYLSVPDFGVAVRIYQKHGMVPWVRNFIFGDQVYGAAFHYTAFDEQILGEIVRLAGFSEFCLVDRLPVSHEQDCSNNVLIIGGENTGMKVSINAVCIR